MPSTVKKLVDKGLISPPKFLADNIHYETIMGSLAYGVSSDSSDYDIYGFCIPPKSVVFPHLNGEILGFGKIKKRFEQYQEHHIDDQTERGGKGRQYDISIYSIVKYFHLCMDNNPNMIDSLFTTQTCVLHSTKVGNMVRENRDMFLHKGSWHKFKGYAYSQLHKMDIKEPKPESKRYESIMEHGYDVKFAYHVVRLLNEVEQILTHGTIDLQQNREQLKSIRRGEWSVKQVKDLFTRKEAELEKLYNESKLQKRPDEQKIKALLLACLEEHYGSLDGIIVDPGAAVTVLRTINDLLEKNKSLLE